MIPLPSVLAVLGAPHGTPDVWIMGTFNHVNGGTLRAGTARVTGAAGTLTSFVADAKNTDSGMLCCLKDTTFGWLYLAGAFTQVNGVARVGIARVNGELGTLDAGWSANTNGSVLGMALSGGLLYFVGNFSQVNGVGRNNAACVDLTTGALQAWNPNLDDFARCIFALGGILYIGGIFQHVGGVVRHAVAAIAADGTLQAWDPDVRNDFLGFPPGVIPAEVFAMLYHGGQVFIAGYFDHIGATARHYSGAADINTGIATAFDPDTDYTVTCLAMTPDASAIYLGGYFVNVTGGINECFGLVRVDPTTGAYDATFNPTFGTANITAVMADESGVYAGGLFNTANGIARVNAAAFDTIAQLLPWDPHTDANVYALVAVPL